MKRVRDIRDQLLGLCDRVEIELTSKLGDVEAIKKAITAGKPSGHLFGEQAGELLLGQLSGRQGQPGCWVDEGIGCPVSATREASGVGVLRMTKHPLQRAGQGKGMQKGPCTGLQEGQLCS